MQEKIYVRIENLDDVKEVINSYIKLFDLITNYYIKNDKEKELSLFLLGINKYFVNFFQCVKFLLSENENDNT